MHRVVGRFDELSDGRVSAQSLLLQSFPGLYFLPVILLEIKSTGSKPDCPPVNPSFVFFLGGGQVISLL